MNNMKDQLIMVQSEETVNMAKDALVVSTVAFDKFVEYIEKGKIKHDDKGMLEQIHQATVGSKVLSKKNRIRLNKVFFHSFVQECNIHVFRRWEFKNARKQNLAELMIVNQVSTPRGIIYFKVPEKKSIIIAFYSHYFDRLAERLCLKIDRIKALEKSISEIVHGKIKALINFTSSELMVYTPSFGLSLGYIRVCKVDDNKRDYSVMLFNTFIAEDMIHKDQLKLLKLKHDEHHNGWSCLEFDLI